MARLVIKDNIIFGGALALGQTLRLGCFTMGAHSAIKPKAAKPATKNCFCVGPEYSNKMDPIDISALNELLDCIAALGVSTDYDQIGLKTDLREINSP